MLVNWAHYLIPKMFCVLSFIANPVFVYLIYTEKSFQFGSYKYLLFFFAVFNVTASLADTLVPVCVHAYRYATVFFTVDGPFSARSRFGEFMVAGRCAFISGTYGILNSHFVYRFLTLCYSNFVNEYFNPWGLICAILWVFSHWLVWALVADTFMAPTPSASGYVQNSFEKVYGNLEKLNYKIVVFSEVPPDVVFCSWFGTLFVTVLASYSLMLYFVLGYKIMSYLNQGMSYMSNKTLIMQRRLFWALAIQTAIPICVSFAPCTLVMFGSAIRIDFMSWVNWMSSIAVSMFPFLDPFAIAMCLPALRRRLFHKFGVNLPPASSNQIHSVPVT